MRQTNLTINYTDSTTGKKSSDKISYVNPNITNQQALTLSQAFANLSQNTYVSTDKTDTYNLNTDIKPARTVSFGQFDRKSVSGNAVDADVLTSKVSRTGLRSTQEGYAYHFTIRITETASPTKTPIVFNGSESFVDVLKFCWNGQGVSSEWGAWDIYLLTSSNEPHVDTFSITLPEEPNFAETTFNFTVHFVEQE